MTELFIILIVMLTLLFWVLFCNEQTYKHRKQVISDFFKEPNVLEKYQQLSYESHLWRLVLGNWNWRSWYYESN